MQENEGKFSFRDEKGVQSEVLLGMVDYKESADKGISLGQLLQQKHGMKTDTAKYGTVLEQMMASSGMFLNSDSTTGLRPPTMKAVLSGQTGFNMGSIVRPSENVGVGARLLFPEVVMQVIESELRTDYGDFLGGWNSMIAQTQTINSAKFEQPIVDVTAPEGSRSGPIGQMAEPDIMVGITTSDVSRKITTKSIGLMISNDALQATSLDLVNLIVGAQSRQERVALVESDISAMIAGDSDRNEAALASVKASSFDSTIAANGDLTHKAWIKYLRANYRKMNINAIISTVDTALAIDGRSGKPTVNSVDNGGSPFSATFSVENLGIPAPRVLLVDDGVVAANTIVGIDTRTAVRRVINASASYSAIEQFVLRKAQAMRFDYGEMSHKLYADGWSVMTLTI